MMVEADGKLDYGLSYLYNFGRSEVGIVFLEYSVIIRKTLSITLK